MSDIKNTQFDAIVVGSGISGGWSAKELTEMGLKVLMLERGRMIEHVKDYHTALTPSWELPHQGMKLSLEELKNYPVQNRTGFAVTEGTKHLFVNDLENPYIEHKPFDWIRGNHVGGRSLMWGRYSFRFSDLDFEANAKEGIGVDWPIRYKDIEKWYDKVEKFAGIAGDRDGIPHLPDGQFQKAMPDSCIESYFRATVNSKFKDRKVISARAAHLTEPTEEQLALGRGKCMYRDLCKKGCPYGAYFSTQSATLPAARKTNNLTLLPHAIVNSIIYDDTKQKATGVRVIDENTGEWTEYFGKMIFLNASALGSTFILMNSISKRFPNGMDDSGQLGHNIMDHHFHVGARGVYTGDQDKVNFGRHPAGLYIPRFRNVEKDTQAYKRGYGYEVYTSRDTWNSHIKDDLIGEELKAESTKFGKWRMILDAFGECLPYYENKVSLDNSIKDKWGQPVLAFDAEHKTNELLMRKDAQDQAVSMMEQAGFTEIEAFDNKATIGLSIHEMGTARMGRDAKTSVFNAYNQHHAVKNVFCTDGAVMTSSPCQNPSLTYMALTARAAAYAVEELKAGRL